MVTAKPASHLFRLDDQFLADFNKYIRSNIERFPVERGTFW
jgi:hypothetical protein